MGERKTDHKKYIRVQDRYEGESHALRKSKKQNLKRKEKTTSSNEEPLPT
jgi:hypothetical protein